MSDTLGQNLRRFREAKDLSLDDLAQMCNVTRDHIGRLERGEAQNPRKHTIDALAKALEVHPFQLMFSDSYVPSISKKRSQVAEPKAPYESQDLPLILLSRISRDHGFDRRGQIKTDQIKKYLRQQLAFEPQAYAVMIDDEAMSPRVNRGETVIVVPSYELESGDLAIIRLPDEKFILRQVEFRRSKVLLESPNPLTETLLYKKSDLRMVHKVVRIYLK